MDIDQQLILDTISGTRNGFQASLLRSLLQAAEPFYYLGSQLKNVLFDTGWNKPTKVSAPVISVGNLTTGGTGKTPTVAWMVQWLHGQGFHPGIASRGYRSLDGESNDEKHLLEQLCPEAPHFQNVDRILACRQLIQSAKCNVIVLDDGFQHRRLFRNVDVVLIDALNPWGYKHLLPRGLLRESVKNLKRADAVLITRTDQVSRQTTQDLTEQIQKLTEAPISQSWFEAVSVVNSDGDRLMFDGLRNQRVCAFSAVGNPSSFRRTLVGNGFAIDEDRFQAFEDHHHFSEQDFENLEKWGLTCNAECLITTRKDLVKINQPRIGGLPVWAVDIELKFPEPPQQLIEILRAKLE